MELRKFNCDYLPNLLEKLSLQNKTLVLLGDFNTNLLKYDTDIDISNFLDLMYSSFLLLQIASPTRTTAASATLIDNYSPITATLLTPLAILSSNCLTIMLNS